MAVYADNISLIAWVIQACKINKKRKLLEYRSKVPIDALTVTVVSFSVNESQRGGIYVDKYLAATS